MKTVTASEFTACAAKVLKEVISSGGAITVTDGGRPVARLEPIVPEGEKTKKLNLGGMRGTAIICGDIVEPLFPNWEPEISNDDPSANCATW